MGDITAAWRMQDAETQFSAVVEAALAGTPQRVTQLGNPAVVVMAVAEYDRLRRGNAGTAPPLSDLLLAMPQDDREFERLPVPERSLES